MTKTVNICNWERFDENSGKSKNARRRDYCWVLVYRKSSIRLCGKVRKLLCLFIEECGFRWIVPNTCVTSCHVHKMAAFAK